MVDTFVARSSDVAVPNPPRFIGEWQRDFSSLRDYLQQFYAATVLRSGLLDPTYQASGSDTIDVTDLPDPTATTIARAQGTANLAVEMLLSRLARRGTFTIEDTSDTTSVTFDEPMPSDDYLVMHSVQGYTGSPDIDAFRVIAVTKEVGGFAIEVTAAPGAGTSVTFAYLVIGDF